MSSHFSVYVDPFVRAPKIERKQVVATPVCSKNSLHTLGSSSGRFCGQCGSPIVSEARTKITTAPAWPPEIKGHPEWSELMAGVDSAKGERFWVSNRGKSGVSLSETGGFDDMTLTSEAIADALLRANGMFGAYLEAAAKELGVALHLEYGVLPYFQ